jgi:anhydro-N-acetylmuramic acid kinase
MSISAGEHPLLRALAKRQKTVVGLMSGTSADGIDAVRIFVEGPDDCPNVTLIEHRHVPFSDEERARILSLPQAGTREICEANFWLGGKFADAALAVLHGESADLVGSHGQTIWHEPPSSTLQIGEPAVIAARTGVVTIGDFRVADVAHGGQGAPLVPYTDWLLYRPQHGRVRALQNIGGIANVTAVGDRLEEVVAFDNGPGNMMIDALAPMCGDPIDRDGALSARGRVQEDLLHELLDDEFLRKKPPKSTGRERYGQAATEAWARAHADRAPHDLLATLVAFTAEAIARSYRDFVPRVDEVLVSGGGAYNRTLMAHLARLLKPVPVRRFDEVQVFPVETKEAIAFAVLAVQALHAVPANVVQVTGARRPAVLGKICLP